MGSYHSTRYLARSALVAWLGLLLGFAGCARAPIPEYTLSEATKALSERHQKQIEAATVRFFGTPTRPQWMKIGEPIEQAEEAEEPASDSAAEAAPDSAADTSAAEMDFGVTLDEVVSSLRLRNGANVYRQRCGGCHGVTGDGGGAAAAYLMPKPRDYRKGIFKFTSTPYGMKPSRADLIRTIRRGAKGTSMPAFPWLSEEDLRDVVDYVILLSQRGEVEAYVAMIADADYEADEDIDPADFVDGLSSVQESWADAQGAVVLPVTAEPAYTDESIAAGRQAFLSRGCSKCHGEDGKGQTEWLSHEFLAEQNALPEDKRIQINYDAWGQPAPAADLTARMLHGGRRPIDIYRRIYTGINGTPMPAFGDALAQEPETLWNLVHFVLSIVEGRSVAAPDTASESDTASGSREANLPRAGSAASTGGRLNFGSES